MATGNEIQDPGTGIDFSRKTQRIINRDGSYNVLKKGSRRGFRDFFKYMLEISWWRFFLILFGGYIAMNIIFTFLYFLCGYENIDGLNGDGQPYLLQTFFFSVQTFTTVGYGSLSPIGFAAQSIATVEAFVGFLSFSLATGLAYGRFSRPNSKIIFSEKMLYSKHKDGQSFKIKLANERDNVLLEVSAKLILTMDKLLADGTVSKSYYQLKLEIERLELLPYTWTLVHFIDADSPFWGKSREELIECNPYFLVLIKGFDETFSQHVHSKHSFTLEDIDWDKRFLKIFAPNEEGVIEFDINDINLTEDE